MDLREPTEPGQTIGHGNVPPVPELNLPIDSNEGSAASSTEDATLVARLRAGEAAAYEAIVRVHSGRMLAVASRFLRNPEDARDAVQESFLSAFKAIDGFGGGARISTWLHRIVVNCALMKIRSRKIRPEESIEDLLPTFVEDGHQAHPSAPWPEDSHTVLEREQRCAYVRSAIAQLPDAYRTVLLLRDIEELDTEETAKLLAITENAVKIRLHRARQALRTLLDPQFRKGELP